MKKVLLVVLSIAILISFTGCDADAGTYKEAAQAFEAGEYAQVIELLDTIPEYDDADDLRRRANGILVSAEAQEAYDAGLYTRAAELLDTKIPDYTEADDLREKVYAAVAFQTAADAVEEKNAGLDAAVNAGQELLDAGGTPLEEAAATELQVSIADAREGKREVPDMPQDAAAILAETQALEEPLDYSALLTALQEKSLAFESSVRQMEQVTNPTGDFIISRINEIENVGEIQGATESNDPNGNLNKQGGYTSATFFTSPLVQEEVYGDNVVQKGTHVGGCIEVYETAENAKRRDEYLAAFDGTGITNPGSHMVCGTVVVRTSQYLTATQQTDLTNQIMEKVTELR